MDSGEVGIAALPSHGRHRSSSSAEFFPQFACSCDKLLSPMSAQNALELSVGLIAKKK